jgi:hypothetical protein
MPTMGKHTQQRPVRHLAGETGQDGIVGDKLWDSPPPPQLPPQKKAKLSYDDDDDDANRSPLHHLASSTSHNNGNDVSKEVSSSVGSWNSNCDARKNVQQQQHDNYSIIPHDNHTAASSVRLSSSSPRSNNSIVPHDNTAASSISSSSSSMIGIGGMSAGPGMGGGMSVGPGSMIAQQHAIIAQQNATMKKKWSPEEDIKLVDLVAKHGLKKWSVIANELPGRKGKQCRERWINVLDPTISKEPWSEDEDRIIITCFRNGTGGQWTKMSQQMVGRTDNAIKNHWHSSMKHNVEEYIRSKNIDGVNRIKNDDGVYLIGDDIEGCLRAARGTEKATKEAKRAPLVKCLKYLTNNNLNDDLNKSEFSQLRNEALQSTFSQSPPILGIHSKEELIIDTAAQLKMDAVTIESSSDHWTRATSVFMAKCIENNLCSGEEFMAMLIESRRDIHSI